MRPSRKTASQWLEEAEEFLTADETDLADKDRQFFMGMLYEQLSGKIIGAAMHVLNTLKPGLDEKIYENSLRLELEGRGHVIEQQRQYPVFYREVNVGTLDSGPDC